jgi:endoglucanase Acf2
VGKGGYTTDPPKGMKLPPRRIYRTDTLKGKIQTTDWWSSLAWEQYSSNHFAHPLAMRAGKDGLLVSYPGASINVVAKHIMAGLQNELTLGHSACNEFKNASVDAASDWFVSVLMAQGDRKMRLSYGHGSPFVYATFAGGSAKITFGGDVKIWSGGANTPTLAVTTKGRHYGLFGPKGSTWTGLDGRKFVNSNGDKAYFSLAVLPDNKPRTLNLFEQYAHSHVIGTTVDWRYRPADSSVETTFAFKTKTYEGGAKGTLFALYPHQWIATEHKLLDIGYASVRGPMKLGSGSRFTTSMRFPGVLPALGDNGAYDRKRLAGYLTEAASRPFKKAPDTYWDGKTLGQIASMIPIAEQLAQAETAAALRKELKSRLENWFTPPGGSAKKDHYFYYDKLWGAMIGQRPSYGSAATLNDHHFHYGYFIRAAAEIARTDKAWAADSAWGGMVKLLIRDIAGADRKDTKFPRLRCFDPYAGHSWASGNAKFADGNNQESSSEAMNAWTGVILWGQATGDRQLRDLGIYLYTTELAAINAYWFDVEQKFFPKKYTQSCAALVWGGKADYGTWFSGEPEHIHGIIMLPMQSGSLYLGLYPKYVQRNLKHMASIRGGYKWKHWHDTFWMYEALHDADKAMARFDAGVKKTPLHSRANTYHWIGNLQVLGQVDRTMNADCPTAITFTNNGKRKHVAWNMTQRTVTVKFSDGVSMEVKPGKCETKP